MSGPSLPRLLLRNYGRVDFVLILVISLDQAVKRAAALKMNRAGDVLFVGFHAEFQERIVIIAANLVSE